MIKEKDYFANLPTDLSTLMNEMRLNFPLPEEVRLPQTTMVDRSLLTLLRETPFKKVPGLHIEIKPQLSYQLFESYPLVQDKSTLKKLDFIAVKAASWTLFRAGWSAFQRYFPDDNIGHGLHLMFRALSKSDSRNRPDKLANLLTTTISLSHDAELFIQGLSLALNLSDRTMDHDTRGARPVDRIVHYLSDYLIEPVSSFGATLIGQAFLSANDADYWSNRSLLFESLPHMPAEYAAQIVARVVRSIRFSVRQRILFYETFAQIWPRADRSSQLFFAELTVPEQRSYQDWLVEHTIRRHFRSNLVKQRFILDHYFAIKDARHITPTILALRFRSFVLIDDAADKDHCWLYSNHLLKNLLNRGIKEEHLSQPRMPARNLKLAIEKGEVRGLLRLRFVGDDLLDVRELFDRVLGGAKSNTNPTTIKNWFG
ncbi:MAG: hypothetical protein ACOX2M_05120 [Fastidiosipilaceae bacterium]|jgi:hypothetical protein